MILQKNIPKSHRNQNRYFTDFKVLSLKQIEFGIYIRNYRRANNLSLQQMADIASVYGKPMNVRFSNADISYYERFQCIPSEKKMEVLMMVMNIEMDDLIA